MARQAGTGTAAAGESDATTRRRSRRPLVILFRLAIVVFQPALLSLNIRHSWRPAYRSAAVEAGSAACRETTRNLLSVNGALFSATGLIRRGVRLRESIQPKSLPESACASRERTYASSGSAAARVDARIT